MTITADEFRKMKRNGDSVKQQQLEASVSAIEFFLPCQVVPKQGDRSRIVNGVCGQFVHHYQPAKVKHNAASLAILAASHRPDEPLRGPVKMSLTFYSPWRKNEKAADLDRGIAYKDTKPDWDNLAKNLCDVLQQTGFFVNDSQLADVHIRKVFHRSPGVLVRIEAADSDELR